MFLKTVGLYFAELIKKKKKKLPFLNKKTKKLNTQKKRDYPLLKILKNLREQLAIKKNRNISFQPNPIKKIMKQLLLSTKHELSFFFFSRKKIKKSTSKTMIQKVQLPNPTLNKNKSFSILKRKKLILINLHKKKKFSH